MGTGVARCAGVFSRQSGFSLVEVLVASSLLAVAIAGVAPLFATASRANVAARNATYAAVLAAQKIEEIRAAAFPDPTDGEMTEYVDPDGASTEDSDQAAYQRRWTIRSLPNHSAEMVVISVAVSQRAAARNLVRLVTIRTRKGSVR